MLYERLLLKAKLYLIEENATLGNDFHKYIIEESKINVSIVFVLIRTLLDTLIDRRLADIYLIIYY